MGINACSLVVCTFLPLFFSAIKRENSHTFSAISFHTYFHKLGYGTWYVLLSAEMLIDRCSFCFCSAILRHCVALSGMWVSTRACVWWWKLMNVDLKMENPVSYSGALCFVVLAIWLMITLMLRAVSVRTWLKITQSHDQTGFKQAPISTKQNQQGDKSQW